MNKIIFFSFNKNKTKEIQNLFSKTNINIIGLNSFSRIKNPIENGSSFQENAKIKSIYGFEKFQKPCFADDSGICISALGGGPGIKSKRFIEKNGGLNKTFNKIIKKTNKELNYKAYFHTCISLTLDAKKTIIFEGRIYGRISKDPKGRYGFHYDPIFIPKGFKKTFAQMTSLEKNKISHRSLAVKKLKKYLLRLYK